MTVSIEWFFFTKMTNQILAGVLQLERILATGEHSIIYQCTDLRTGSTHICKKICYSRFNQSEEDALNYELTVAHRVTHGNVVAYLDVIHDKPCETYYIVMPFTDFMIWEHRSVEKLRMEAVSKRHAFGWCCSSVFSLWTTSIHNFLVPVHIKMLQVRLHSVMFGLPVYTLICKGIHSSIHSDYLSIPLS